MKITRRQLRQIISENREQDLENRKALDAWLATGKSKEEFPDYDEWGKEYVEKLLKMKVNESTKITRRQLRQIIKEEIGLLEADSNSDGSLDADELRDLADDLEGDDGPNFPPLSHPLISQYADNMRGPVVSDTKVGDAWGDPWFKEYVSYTYSARPNNIQAKQSITLYRLLNDKYFARIYGSYNNRVSHKNPGEFDDPIAAIQAALDSSVGGYPPPAKNLIKKVGEKISGDPTGGAWYD